MSLGAKKPAAKKGSDDLSAMLSTKKATTRRTKMDVASSALDEVTLS
jgi:hypothetical protein